LILINSNFFNVMQFYPQNAPVPAALKTAEFILRPLTPTHVELDYAALMVSKEILRLWSGSPWPQDDFTIADNLKDLARHHREHQERIAFTYTMLNPSETECLGCVYINPLSPLIEHNREILGAAVVEDHAIVRFWVIQPRLADDLDKRLLGVLTQWFAADWAFARVLFHAREVHERQLQLFAAAGLQHVYTLLLPRRSSYHQFWGNA
jgi:hypothetical protein